MWDAKWDIIDPFKLVVNVFIIEDTRVCHQCVRLHYYWLFVTAFLLINLLYTSTSIPVINCIDYKVKEKIKAFAFAPSMFNESSLANNIMVFEDFSIMQMGIEKTNLHWSNWLMI